MTQLTGKAPELDLELDSEIADGIYSNLAIISHSASEFVVDFATILPGLAKPYRADTRTCQAADAFVAGQYCAL